MNADRDKEHISEIDLSDGSAANKLDAIKNIDAIAKLVGRITLKNVDLSSLFDIVRSTGAKIDSTKPLTITTRHLYAILNDRGILSASQYNYHGLPKEIFLDALKAANEPLFIAKKGRDRFSAFLEIKDPNGNNVLCAFNFDFANGNHVLSVYGKRLNKGYFRSNEVIFFSKKIKNGFESAFRTQFPGRTDSVYGYIMERYSTKNNG